MEISHEKIYSQNARDMWTEMWTEKVVVATLWYAHMKIVDHKQDIGAM